MKVDVISRKLIKPHTPTPKNLNKYKISFIDEASPPIGISVLLFFPSKPNQLNDHHHLEESLSKTLVRFYPLAGRYIKEDSAVDCSDQGAHFAVAQVNDVVDLSDFIAAATDTVQLSDLLPRPWDRSTDPLLSVQITELKPCGGLVISATVSHRIFDASSLGTFIAAWSNTSPVASPIIPGFESSSLFPLRKNPSEASYNFSPSAKRFVFNKEAITKLRSELKDGGGLSRVRIVCAVIAKALIGVDLAKHGKARPCMIGQAVNMRNRTVPPLPTHSCGNLVVQALLTQTQNQIKHLGIQEIVHLLGEAVQKAISYCAQVLSLQGGQSNVILVDPSVKRSEMDEVNLMWFSDWSKFEFYEADFGWGKPVWASVGAFPSEKLTLLMNNKEGGGIEAWVHLNHDDMAYFLQDEHIKLVTA